MVADWFVVTIGIHDTVFACHACVERCVLTAVMRPQKCIKEKPDETERVGLAGNDKNGGPNPV